MFSRLAPLGTQGLAKSLLTKHQPSSTIIIKSIVTQTPSNTATSTPQNAAAAPPAESSKRDLVNFPRRARVDYAPPTRLGFIPESWFQFFYPKTGVTGPYMLGFGALTYIMSKEILVVGHHFAHVVSFIIVLTVIHQKFGDKIAAIYNKALEAEERELDSLQDGEKNRCKEMIKHLNDEKIPEETINEIFKAKKENVMLQMEAAYRDRLEEVFRKSKAVLDYHVELQNVEKRIAQKNLFDYVMRNVLKSITPDQEKLALQNCIKDLNSLAART